MVVRSFDNAQKRDQVSTSGAFGRDVGDAITRACSIDKLPHPAKPGDRWKRVLEIRLSPNRIIHIRWDAVYGTDLGTGAALTKRMKGIEKIVWHIRAKEKQPNPKKWARAQISIFKPRHSGQRNFSGVLFEN